MREKCKLPQGAGLPHTQLYSPSLNELVQLRGVLVVHAFDGKTNTRERQVVRSEAQQDPTE